MDPAGAVQILTIVVALFLFYLGAAVGSFLNVVAYRVPAGLSIVTPRSPLPALQDDDPLVRQRPGAGVVLPRRTLPLLRRADLRPLRGRRGADRGAGRGGLLALRAAAGRGSRWASATGSGPPRVFFAFSAALIAVALVDWDVQIVPDEISLPGIALGVAACVVTPVTPADAAIGAACGGAVLLAVAKGYFLLTRREGMGMGDVKLLAMIGAFLGWQALPFVLLGASLSGIAVGIVLIRMRGKGLRHAFAFGPFLCAAAIAYLFVGDALTRWYLGAMGVRLLPGVGGLVTPWSATGSPAPPPGGRAGSR